MTNSLTIITIAATPARKVYDAHGDSSFVSVNVAFTPSPNDFVALRVTPFVIKNSYSLLLTIFHLSSNE